MLRNAHCVAPDLAYHARNAEPTARRSSFLQQNLYLDLVREHMGEAGVRVIAYCLMRSHVPLVVAPARAESLALLISRVHGRYAQFVNIRRKRSGHLWQARYYSCPVSSGHLATVLRYVERNPCRAGIAARPEE
jgi:putative transposase